MTPSKAEIAQALQCSLVTVYHHAKRGMPLDSVEAAKDWRAKHIKPGRPRKDAPSPTARVKASREILDRKHGEEMDYFKERCLTERVTRELKELQLSEKRGQLINIELLEPALEQIFSSFKTELLGRDQKLADELNALYGIEIDVNRIHEHTHAALDQLAGYDPTSARFNPSALRETETAGENYNDGMGEEISPLIPEIDG